MSKTLNHIWDLAERNELKISDHGYDELAADNILVREIVHSLKKAELLEDYPDLETDDFLACLAYATKLSQIKSIYTLAS